MMWIFLIFVSPSTMIVECFSQLKSRFKSELNISKANSKTFGPDSEIILMRFSRISWEYRVHTFLFWVKFLQ